MGRDSRIQRLVDEATGAVGLLRTVSKDPLNSTNLIAASLEEAIKAVERRNMVFDNEDGQWFGAKSDHPTPLDFTKAVEDFFEDAFREFGHNPHSAAQCVFTVRMREATPEEAEKYGMDIEGAMMFAKADEVGDEYWSVDTNMLPVRAMNQWSL